MTHSGPRYTVNTPVNRADTKVVLDRDKNKMLGDATVSSVSSARRNVLGLGKSSYNRIMKRLKYHPYKPICRYQLKPGDLPWRLQFFHWLTERSDEEIWIWISWLVTRQISI